MGSWFNGKEYKDENEFVYGVRGFRELKNDDHLIKFAEKITNHWYDAGWHKTFTTFYLSDYALSEPRKHLTRSEFERLKALQKKAIEMSNVHREQMKWAYVRTECFADNSVEEVWANKFGNEKRVMSKTPCGDAC